MRKTLHLLLLGAVLAFASGAPALSDDVNADVLKAESLGEAGKYDQALDILNKYLASHPQDARALVDRGDIYQNESKLPQSVADYTAALAINPQYAYAYATRADSYNQMGDYARAATDATKALELRPNYAYALRVRSLSRVNTQDLAGAQDDIHRAIAAEPNVAFSYATACRIDRIAGQPANAKKECLTALQIDPSSYRASFELGLLQIDASAWTDAEATFSKVLSIEKGDDPYSNYWRADARFALHQGDGALSDINAYVSKYPDDGDGYYLRAQIDRIRGDLTAAKVDAKSALDHYGVGNDTDGMAKAKALLDQLNAAHP
jgi:tetratricopeptide (TPR) repeat protein